MKAWILRENDYYDSDSTTVGITLNKELAEYWDTLTMCYTEELEIDPPTLMNDYRITGEFNATKGFEHWKRDRKKKKGAK